MHDEGKATDVLIIGAGPTGLSLACDLARRGVAHRIIERADAYSVASRAKTVMPRSLEVADDLGVVGVITAKGVVDLPARYYDAAGDSVDKPGVAVAAGAGLGTPYPDPVWIAEFDVESALRDRHAQLGGRVELASTATDLHQDADGVTVTVRTPTGARSIRARYVVGADGGRSRTRRLIDAPLVGTSYDTQRWYLGDVRLDGGLERNRMHVWFSGEGMLGLTPLPSTDIWQLQATVAADIPEPEQPSLELYQAMLAGRAGAENVRITQASWLSLYRVNVRMVGHYRVGHVFLAGDAAHVHSPAGGQGMNTGIQDAYNLGWKLAAVLAGADPTLLDTYDQERRPVARAVLEDSTNKMSAVMSTVTGADTQPKTLGAISDDLTSGLLVSYRTSALTQPATGPRTGAPQPGDRAPDAAGLHGGDNNRSLFDLLRGPHWTLLVFTDHSQPSLTAINRTDLQVHLISRAGQPTSNRIIDLQGNAYQAYASDGDELVLIRPDGYIAAREPSERAKVISDYLNRVARVDGKLSDHPATTSGP